MFTVDVPGALQAIADKKKGGGRKVLKELGEHPESGKEMRILEGRYGPYVTDGSINATLPKGSEPDEIDADEAVALLAAKAARGGGKGRGRKGGGSKGKGKGKGKARSGAGK
jgi:DNA topoisomerase-1